MSWRYLYLFWCIIYWLMPFAACVAMQTPEGGAPDETPPKLIRSFPENGTLNFKGSKLRFTFDKEITVDNIYKNLLVMPKLDKPKNKEPFSYKLKRKTLEIKLNVPLKTDTTYAFHLHNTVKDCREGTKATNTVVTFSTGPFIDPITLKGKTKALLTNKPIGAVNVYLYSAERDPQEWQKAKQDANYDKEKCIPDYYTTTDQEGNFTINHIRLGHYYIRAVTGAVNNYQIDYEKEQYGFFKDPVDLTDSQENIVIPLVQADVRDFQFLRVASQKGLCEIVFNKAIQKYQLFALQSIGMKGKPQLYSCLSEKSPKTIRLYNTFNLLSDETFNIKVVAKDALHMVVEKEIGISFREGKAVGDKTGLQCSIVPRLFLSVLPRFTESITFSKPIKEVNPALMYFECKDQMKILLKEEELEWNADKTKLTIKKNFSEKEIAHFITAPTEPGKEKEVIPRMVKLQVEAGACISFDRDKNKKISLEYPLRNEPETGTIAGSIDTAISHFIIELLHAENSQVIDSIRDQKQYQFTMVPPGIYKVRIRVLQEGEEEWSPGNIRKNIEPNPVIFYEQDITVVEKWAIQSIDFKF